MKKWRKIKKIYRLLKQVSEGCAGEDVGGYGEEVEEGKKKHRKQIQMPSCRGRFNLCKSVHYVYAENIYNTIFTKNELALYVATYRNGYNKKTIK